MSKEVRSWVLVARSLSVKKYEIRPAEQNRWAGASFVFENVSAETGQRASGAQLKDKCR
jgi:hypothetical protein